MNEHKDDIFAYYDNLNSQEIDSLWHLSEDLSVKDAAALIAGYNPEVISNCENDTHFNEYFKRYPIVFKAITNAITNEKLKANIRYSAREYGHADAYADMEYSEINLVHSFGTLAEEDEQLAEDSSCYFKPFPDWSLSTVERDAVVTWLKARNVEDSFFSSKQSDGPEYLDIRHSRYAPKLAASISAWLALEDKAKTKGKSPKQALSKWLREHAADYKLSDEEGKPNETGIEECAKVANWQDKGGAPKTPSS